MGQIDNFEVRKKEININIIASMRQVETNIKVSSIRLFGNPQTQTQGYQQNVEMFSNNSLYRFPPFDHDLPMYISESRNLITNYTMMRNYLLGREGREKEDPGYIRQYQELVEEMIQFMRDNIMETETYKAELQRRDDQIKELAAQVDKLQGGQEAEEDKYVEFLVNYYINRSGNNREYVLKEYFTGGNNKNNILRKIVMNRLSDVFDIHFKKVRQELIASGKDITVTEAIEPDLPED